MNNLQTTEQSNSININPLQMIGRASFPMASFPRASFPLVSFSFSQPTAQSVNIPPGSQVNGIGNLPQQSNTMNIQPPPQTPVISLQQSQQVSAPHPGLLDRITKGFSNLFHNTMIIDNANQQNQPPTPTPKPTPILNSSPTPEQIVALKIEPRRINKLISLLVAEAGDEGIQGMQGALNSIINRTQVNPIYYGKDAWGVITKDGQYDGFTVKNPHYIETLNYLDGKKKDLSLGRQNQIEEAQQLISLAKQGKLQDITDGATHYYNPEIAAHKPWMDVAVFKKDIGNHRFVYLYK